MSNDEAFVPRKYKNKRIRAQQPLSDFIGRANHANHPVENKVVEEKSQKSVKTNPQKNKKDTRIKKFINSFVEENGPNIFSEVDVYDVKVLSLLCSLKKNFDIKWKQNENRARARRVMITGIHEIVKHIKNDSIKVIFVSRNIDQSVQNWVGQSSLIEMSRIAVARGVPVIHSNTKKEMSTAIKKFPYINVVGVMAFNGFESLFLDITRAWKNSRSHILYHDDQSSLFP